MFFEMVHTVSRLRLFLRLATILSLTLNSELERRLRRRAYFQRQSATWISAIADYVHTLVLPYWIVAGPREWVRVWTLVVPFANKEISVDFLVYSVSSMSSTALTRADMMLLISSREILRALVLSNDRALTITKTHDVEFGKRR